MRKAMLFAAISMLLVAACTKQETVSPAVDVQKVDEVLVFKGDPGSRVVAFNILSPAEKAHAFKKHIRDNYLKVAVTEEQKRLAEEAIEMIVPEMYMADKKEQFTGMVAALEYKARQLFNEDGYYLLFESLASIENETTLSNQNETPIETVFDGNCECRTDWYCERKTGSDLSTCSDKNCVKTDDGCGLFGWSSCTGKCSGSNIEN